MEPKRLTRVRLVPHCSRSEMKTESPVRAAVRCGAGGGSPGAGRGPRSVAGHSTGTSVLRLCDCNVARDGLLVLKHPFRAYLVPHCGRASRTVG